MKKNEKGYEGIVEKMMEQISLATAKLNETKAKRDLEIAESKASIIQKYAEEMELQKTAIDKLEKSLQTTLRQHQNEFIGENAKPTRTNTYGSYGWREGNDTVMIEDEEELAAFFHKDPAHNADLGSDKFTANKEGIKRRLKSGSAVPGCKLTGKRRSFYTLKDTTVPDEKES